MIIIYKTLSGSRLYDTESPYSDTDYKVVYIKPTIDILSTIGQIQLGGESQQINDNTDIRYIEVGHFMEQLSKSNPNYIEILFSESYVKPDPFVLIRDEFFKSIFNVKPFVKACIGMSLSDMKRFNETDNAKHSLSALRTLNMCKVAVEQHKIVLNVKGFIDYEKILKKLVLIKNTIGSYPDKTDWGLMTSKDDINYCKQLYEELLAYIRDYDKSEFESEPNIKFLSNELYKIRINNLISNISL